MAAAPDTMHRPPTRIRTGRVRRGWAWGDLAYPAALLALMAAAPWAAPLLVWGMDRLMTAVSL